jgi:hypothetical protein
MTHAGCESGGPVAGASADSFAQAVAVSSFRAGASADSFAQAAAVSSFRAGAMRNIAVSPASNTPTGSEKPRLARASMYGAYRLKAVARPFKCAPASNDVRRQQGQAAA